MVTVFQYIDVLAMDQGKKAIRIPNNLVITICGHFLEVKGKVPQNVKILSWVQY